jgi:hypothetical protein
MVSSLSGKEIATVPLELDSEAIAGDDRYDAAR